MKKICLLFVILIIHASIIPSAWGCKPETMGVVATMASNINTATLQVLLKSDIPVALLDARTDDCVNGRRLPKAKYINASSTPEEIFAAVPAKDVLIVVYSGDSACNPNNQLCVKRLSELGYSNMLVYTAGAEIWEKLGNPVDFDKDVKKQPASKNKQ